jgi:hypothetical protein
VIAFKRLILIIIALNFQSCAEQKKQTISVTSENEISKPTNISSNSSGVDPCKECDIINKSIPVDSFSFEKLFGYPNGTRQEQAYDDIQLYFKCLNECYKSENLIKLIKLSATIKYDADGPSHVQSNLQRYIKKNKELITELYNEIECNIFKKHLKFLFEGIDSGSVNELNKVFNSLGLKDSCKSKAIGEIPKMISHEH